MKDTFDERYKAARRSLKAMKYWENTIGNIGGEMADCNAVAAHRKLVCEYHERIAQVVKSDQGLD